jgi:hypothetical protein
MDPLFNQPPGRSSWTLGLYARIRPVADRDRCPGGKRVIYWHHQVRRDAQRDRLVPKSAWNGSDAPTSRPVDCKCGLKPPL